MEYFKMNKNNKIFLSLSIAVALSACDGGPNDDNSNVAALDYQGEKEFIQLDSEIMTQFEERMTYIPADLPDNLNSTTNTMSAMRSVSNDDETFEEDNYETCDSGSISMDKANPNSVLGEYTISADSCSYFGNIITGSATIDIKAVDSEQEPTDISLSAAFNITQGSAVNIDLSTNLNLTINYVQENVILDTSILVEDSVAQQSQYLESFHFEGSEQQIVFDGSLYFSDLGKVSFSSITSLDEDDSVIDFMGAEGSKARIHLYGDKAALLEVDEDGDGVFEYSEDQDWGDLSNLEDVFGE